MVGKERIYLSPPHLSGWEERFVRDAFASNWVAPLGPQVDAFEREVADYVGAKGGVSTNTGTAAIHMALRLAGTAAQDTVFCSALTFVASASPILYLGAAPVFIDSEPATWNMSKDALQRAFRDAEQDGRMPKAVIVVNLYGQSADLGPISEICRRYKVPLIEDAAESLGATYRGKASGTIGQFGIYSFNGNKLITTSGGGMLVSNDQQALEKAKFWATQARDPARHYQHSELGYNYRLSNLLAAVGRGQLQVIEERIAARRLVFERYHQALHDIEGIEFMPEAPFGRATRWLTALWLHPGRCAVTAGQLVEALEAENIEARPVWKPLHLQPLFQGCRYYPHSAGESVSERLFQNGICLPSGSNLSEAAQERVIDCVRRSLQNGPGAQGAMFEYGKGGR
ncbi:DegT/DnrJ/EryC1/StrS family aminotransferase [Brevibacillus massiliensis]|jgi:pyridoxal phosphate-dependent aminotransferase EpsN|uniref:DegT/DnrJ/EryC1/StrS family aminotransferase n=1 Tax=Brevibacillus massiliensis TaxID=1118054 RepID=UPI0002E35940|nr:aminotransferase class I/II-fold pyridoxal phosphate-dependent enzyme [Brevibacillus massiliensis]